MISDDDDDEDDCGGQISSLVDGGRELRNVFSFSVTISSSLSASTESVTGFLPGKTLCGGCNLQKDQMNKQLRNKLTATANSCFKIIVSS